MELPKVKRQPVSFNPKFMVLMGRPKSGKSTVCAALEDNLIIDLEDGYRGLEAMVVNVNTTKEYYEVADALKKAMEENGGKYPYKRITVDNASRLEDIAVQRANQLYRTKTPMGANWGMLKDAQGNMIKNPKTGKPVADPKADVRLLPQGGGWQHYRDAVKEIARLFQPYCETLILVTHTKDKQVKFEGTEVTEVSVDLAGKTADVICGLADAVGLIYRKDNKTIMSFKGGDGTVRESRCSHLRGKDIVVCTSDQDNNLEIDLSKVFIETEN